MKIEICLDSPSLALEAQQYGANRVELCANLLEGGTTPSAGCIAITRQKISIGLFVIIRPRGGDFYYNQEEIEQMKYDVQLCKELGVDGVVIGLLNQDGRIDLDTTKELIDLAKPMEVTFHRAFDRCQNPFVAVEELINLGVNRILTSGQYPHALDGKDVLKRLIEQAQNRIIIMPGSGVNQHNVQQLLEETNATEFHFTAHQISLKNNNYQHPNFPISEHQEKIFDVEKIKGCLDVIKR